MVFRESLKEVIRILVGTLVLTCIMWAVFSVAGYFSYKAVLGGLIGTFAAVLNFAFLALTLEISLGKGARKAQAMMGLSYTLRLLFIAAIIIFAIKSPYVNYIAVAIPLVFPRIVITALNMFNKFKKEDERERT